MCGTEAGVLLGNINGSNLSSPLVNSTKKLTMDSRPVGEIVGRKLKFDFF
jgi:hypothetical protein